MILPVTTSPLLKFYSTVPKTLKAESFSTNPKSLKVESFSLPNIPHEDVNDFRKTKLIHGKTEAELAITERAAEKLNEIALEEKNPNTALRISVESGGCHGFQYNLILTDLTKELESGSDLLVFKRDDGGRLAQVILDPSSLDILQDSKIDYTTELIGSSFKVVDSPYTSSACGCGSSFDFDFEKLQKKLEEKSR